MIHLPCQMFCIYIYMGEMEKKISYHFLQWAIWISPLAKKIETLEMFYSPLWHFFTNFFFDF